MADQTVTVELKAVMNVDDIKSKIGKIQKDLGSIKMPDKFKNSLSGSFDDLGKLLDKYQAQLNKGFTTKKDASNITSLGNQIDTTWNKIAKTIGELTGQKISFQVDTKQIKEAEADLERIGKLRAEALKSFAEKGLDSKGRSLTSLTDEFSTVAGGRTKAGKTAKELQSALAVGDVEKSLELIQRLKIEFDRLGDAKKQLFKDNTGIQATTALERMEKSLLEGDDALKKYNKDFADMQTKVTGLRSDRIEDARTLVSQLANDWNQLGVAQKEYTKNTERAAETTASRKEQVANLERQVETYFGLTQILRKVINIGRQAYKTVKELDAAMVETAVVTNFDVGDMWEMLPTYTANANELGSTIKDVYEASTLYYQQGLNTAQAMGLANETLKMARIGGLQAAEATDMMTAALRGFNMQINELSAQRINDVYSKLAAITASDTRELGEAMERTASIANSAGMEFETTSAFLAQMIETTREAPENLGTAMKTIVARFQEMKEDPTALIDADGEVLNANRVDKALKSIGISLMDENGQFRKLDEVFLEISSRWDGLTQAQQRYIATIAAGSRQQSRFIAMMQNHERVTELVEAANNSAGASQAQFEKTLEGMSAKLNRLKNAWDQYTMGLANNQILKGMVDGLTSLLTLVNKLVDVLGNAFPDPFSGLVKSVVTLSGTLAGLNLAKVLSRGVIRGGVDWWKGTSGTGLIGSIYDQSKIAITGDHAQVTEEGVNNIRSDIKKGVEKKAIDVSPKLSFSKGFTIAGTIDKQVSKELDRLYTGYSKAINQGALSPQQAAELFVEQVGKKGLTDVNGKLLDYSGSIPELTEHFRKGADSVELLGNKITGAGTSLRTFSSLLYGTPLQPFAILLDKVGTAIQLLGTNAAKATKFILTETAAILLENKALDENIRKTLLDQKAKGQYNFKTIVQGLLSIVKASKDAGGGLRGLGKVAVDFFKKLPKTGKIGLAIAAVALAGLGLYRVLTADDRALQSAQRAAGLASDAYASASQASSELKDNLEKLNEISEGFDGLVEGTAAFNEQLVQSNELILQLLKRYPLLYEYLSTDNNGRMIISDEGLEAVEKYQDGLTSFAAAMNNIKNGEYNALKASQEAAKASGNINKLTAQGLRGINYSGDDRLLKQQEKELGKLQEETFKLSSRTGAITTVTSDKELDNQKAITQLYADQYELRKKQVDTGLPFISREKNRNLYAEAYGYTWNGKDFLDADGNQVDIKYKDVKNAIPDIKVLADVELESESLDDAINKANNAFESEFDWNVTPELAEGKNTFISDVLAKEFDTNEDLLQAFLEDSDTIVEDLFNQLSDAEVAALIGKTEDWVAKAPGAARDKLKKQLVDDAESIVEAQSAAYEELAVMLGKAAELDPESASTENKILDDFIKLSQKEQNAIYKAGSQLQESAGVETMKTMVQRMKEIYESEGPIDEMQEIIDEVDWSNPIERLEAFNELANSGVAELEAMGEELLSLGESFNLLNAAFEEVYDSTDFQKALEDIGELTDATGRIDASGIEELAESSSTLNKFLEAGIMTSGGFALALNALHSDAEITLSNLNQDVLKLLDSFGELDTAIAKAHKTIENFDAGIDTGEADDFMVDTVEAWQELVDNGEWGNSQLRKYTELIYGIDNFNKKLQENGGDLRKTYQQLESDIGNFEDGYSGFWQKLANDPEIGSVTYDGSEIQIEFTGDIEDYIKQLSEETGYSIDMVRMAVESFANSSRDLQANLNANAFKEAFTDPTSQYVKNRTVWDEGEKRLVLTESEITTVLSGIGQNTEEGREQYLQEIADAAGVTADKITTISDLDENGMLRTDYDQLARERSEAFIGEGAGQNDWLQDFVSAERSGIYDLEKAIETSIQDGYSDQTTYGMILEAIKDGEKFEYKGTVLDPEEINSENDLKDLMSEIDDDARWNDVGANIASGYLDYIKGKEHPIIDGLKKLTDPNNIAKRARKNNNPNRDDGVKTTGPIARVSTDNATTTVKHQIEVNKKELEQFINGDRHIELTPEMTRADLDAAYQEAGLDAPKEIVVNAEDPNGTIQQIYYDISELPDDVPIEAWMLDNFTGPADAAIQSFEGASVDIPVNVHLTETARAVVEAFGDLIKNGGSDNFILEGFYQQNKGLLDTYQAIVDADDAAKNAKEGAIVNKGHGGVTNNKDDDKSGSGGGEEEKEPTINNFSIQEIIRYDAEKRLETYQNQLDSLEKKLTNALEKIGTTTKDISKDLSKRRENLNNQIEDQKLVTKTYNKQLKRLDKGYSQTFEGKKQKGYFEYVSWQTAAGDEKKQAFNLSKYIKYDKKSQTYQIDENKIDTTARNLTKNGNDRRAIREALYKSASEALDPLQSGLLDSKQKTEDLKEELKEFDRQVFETFYGWENELTKIYNLTQKIEIDSSMSDRFNSQVSMELARLGALSPKFVDVSAAVSRMTQVLERNNKAIERQLSNQRSLIAARRQEIKTNTSLTDEIKLRDTMRKRYGKKSGEYEAANEQVTAQRLTNKYMKVSYNRDGSASVNIDWKGLEKAYYRGDISDTTYEAIKQRIDDTTQAITDYNNSIQEQTDLLASLYDQLAEYQKTIADFEDTLLKQLEEDLKEKINNLKTLNQSLTAALKDILDTVKKRLQERRQTEDNAKTERDIDQKQQRLNLLRSSTAGGNRVEIAQLEKEIADAQQSYRRTLEDQLLQKLQDQADEAAKQREKQIKLAEQQLETQKIQLKERVARWMQHPKTYEKVMREAWLKANNYDDKGLYGQRLLLQEWDKTFADYREAGIQANYIDSSRETLGGVINSIGNVRDAVTNLNLNKANAQFYKDTGKTVTEAKKANPNFTVKELKQGGYSYSEIRKGGYNLQDFINSGITDAKTLKAAGFGKYALYNKGYTTTALKAAGYKTSDMVTNTVMRGVAAAIRETGGGWNARKGDTSKLVEVFGEKSAAKIMSYVNSKSFDPKKYYKKGVYNYATQKKKKYAKYKTGGLADYTGPAWLDGTPSKPELVLNAADTQNFIQLKDILSSALRSGALETSAVTVGDTNFEVNINVDHIASDYDVDRVAERVKKKIVESSSYRNVTSVRKFR